MNNPKLYFDSVPQTVIETLNHPSDGSGITASVTEPVAKRISEYINKKFNSGCKQGFAVADIGCGQGYLTKELNKFDGVLAYGLEGSSSLLPLFQSDKCFVFNILSDIPDGLKKAFDLTCSFECIEHILPEEQKRFWNNLGILSNRHLCSIHICPPLNLFHRTIWTREQWIQFFSENSIEVEEEISQEAWNAECSEWQCSLYFVLKFN